MTKYFRSCGFGEQEEELIPPLSSQKGLEPPFTAVGNSANSTKLQQLYLPPFKIMAKVIFVIVWIL